MSCKVLGFNRLLSITGEDDSGNKVEVGTIDNGFFACSNVGRISTGHGRTHQGIGNGNALTILHLQRQVTILGSIGHLLDDDLRSLDSQFSAVVASIGKGHALDKLHVSAGNRHRQTILHLTADSQTSRSNSGQCTCCYLLARIGDKSDVTIGSFFRKIE